MPNILPYIVFALFVIFCIYFLSRFYSASVTGTNDSNCPALLDFHKKIYYMERKDLLPVLLITGIYAVVAFFGLGDLTAPQTFCNFSERGRFVDIELSEPQVISKLMYYTGLYHSDNYYLQFSTDGENWIDQVSMEQGHADVFKWKYAELLSEEQYVRFIRIIAGAQLELGELVLYDSQGMPISADKLIFNEGAAPLFDEQDIAPERSTYLNSTYFDEIYHARTAYEHIRGVYPYEVSHPPLGKLIISIGIRLFDMTPFGWRFMGVLFGVMMIPCIYVFIKNMFGVTLIASCGSLIFAFDFMHYVQTRISTIDTYGVFFIILMYYFMYRFITTDRDSPYSKSCDTLLPLFASGLFFGIGAASKWTVIYGGAGLALIWLLFWIFRGRDLIKSGRSSVWGRELGVNILWCLLFFIAIPALVYYVSYIPYGQAKGMSTPSMLWDKEYAKTVIDNQSFMFTYHRDVVSEHPYSSRWYQWIFNIKPILYYQELSQWPDKSVFAAFLSPLLCWAGLFSTLFLGYLSIAKKDGRALFILIGFLSQLVPWLFISRLTFEYHYFPSTVFLVLAICYAFDALRRGGYSRWKPLVYAFTALSILLFIGFYPVLSGATVSDTYTTNILKWMPSWPF